MQGKKKRELVTGEWDIRDFRDPRLASGRVEKK
jgi:hypothetical protein